MMTWVARCRFGLRSLPLRFGCWCELCTVEEAVGYFFISFVLFPLLTAACNICVGIESLGLVIVVTVAQKYKDARESGNTALSSPCWDLLAAMRRVVNYHSSWARQQQVELFDASGNSGFTAGRGFNPAGGAQEVVRMSQLCILFICTGITAGGMSRELAVVAKLQIKARKS
ncbi:abc transporter [Dorcoceras hygrometricum]|uniref:Abc transporter n=1 Tax=Dorcoceras hygrometricum TaxID=472368 RepID=A0A2Z7B4B9_9LAMI|nr:abc transporter [Dorcoceras hygrometricum]